MILHWTTFSYPKTSAARASWLELQELLCIFIIDLVLLLRRQTDLLDEVDAFFLEHEQGRRVRSKNEVVLAHGVEGTARRRRVVAGGFQIHHFEIMQRLMLNQHRLVGAEEERLILQAVRVIHT